MPLSQEDINAVKRLITEVDEAKLSQPRREEVLSLIARQDKEKLSAERRQEVEAIATAVAPASKVVKSSLANSLAASNTALRQTNASLADRNKALKEEISDNWKKPQDAFKLVVALLAVLGFIGIARELITLNRINTLADRLETEVDSSADMRTKFLLEVSRFDILQAARSEASSAALTALSLLERAQDELYQEHAPRQALIYLDNAEEKIESASFSKYDQELTDRVKQLFDRNSDASAVRSDISNLQISGDLSPVEQTLESIRYYIRVQRAECYVRMNAIQQLRDMRAQLFCPPGAACNGNLLKYYAGLISARSVLDELQTAVRNDLRSKAINEFSAALGSDNRESNPVQLLLALLYLDGQKFQKAISVSDGYLNSLKFSSPAEYRNLPSQVRSRILIARVVRGLAQMASGQSDGVEALDAPDCTLSVYSLGVMEAKLIRDFFNRAIDQREKILPAANDKEAANAFGYYCVKMIAAIDYSCKAVSQIGMSDCGGGCGAASPGCEGDGITKDQYIDALAADYGLWKPDDRVLLSRDTSLGVESGNRFYVMYVSSIPGIETRTISRKKCRPVEKTYVYEVALNVIKEGKPETITVEKTETYTDYEEYIEDQEVSVSGYEAKVAVYENPLRHSLPLRRYLPLSADFVPDGFSINTEITQEDPQAVLIESYPTPATQQQQSLNTKSTQAKPQAILIPTPAIQ